MITCACRPQVKPKQRHSSFGLGSTNLPQKKHRKSTQPTDCYANRTQCIVVTSCVCTHELLTCTHTKHINSSEAPTSTLRCPKPQARPKYQRVSSRCYHQNTSDRVAIVGGQQKRNIDLTIPARQLIIPIYICDAMRCSVCVTTL